MQKTAILFSMMIAFVLATVLNDAFAHCHDGNCAGFAQVHHQAHDHADDRGGDADQNAGDVAKHCGHTHLLSLLALSDSLLSDDGMKDRAVVIYRSGVISHPAEPLLEPPSQA